jgi:tetratricopeptide (TPR) repeat protein
MQPIATRDPGTPRDASPAHAARRGVALARWVALAAATTFAGWAWTRSDALGQAELLEPRAGDPEGRAHVVRLALEHLRRQPWSRPAALLAARNLSRLDFPERAEPYYQRAGTLDHADAHLRAYAILRSNRRDEAITAYRAILGRWPDDRTALELLGGLYFSRRQYDEALEVARQLIRTPGGAVQGHWRAASILHETGNPEEAAAEFEAVLRIDPRLEQIGDEARPWFWFRMGSDLLSIGQAERTLELLGAALAIGEDAKLRLLHGRAAHQLGELDAAEADFRRALEADPDLGAGWLELGRLLLARSRPAEAADALERASRHSPNDPTALYSLRLAYERLGRRDEARRLGERARELRRRNPEPPRGMGAGAMPDS